MYIEAACKNPHSHSAAGEESSIFLFRSKKIKRGDSSGLRLQDDGERSNGIILNTMASF